MCLVASSRNTCRYGRKVTESLRAVYLVKGNVIDCILCVLDLLIYYIILSYRDGKCPSISGKYVVSTTL